jgi:N-ethylmaleimide reductase
MKNLSLFEPLELGSVTLPNRLDGSSDQDASGPGNAPTALNATYYEQRANAGLIIAEGTAVS